MTNHPPSRAPDAPAPTPERVDFGALFDVTPAPCLVLAPTLTIVTANAAYLQLTQRTLADLAGRDVFTAFPDNPDDPQADGVAKLRASLLRVLATGSTDKMAAPCSGRATGNR